MKTLYCLSRAIKKGYVEKNGRENKGHDGARALALSVPLPSHVSWCKLVNSKRLISPSAK